MCTLANDYELRQVVERVHESMSEDCDCEKHRHQMETSSFDDDWELAPLSMTRTTEAECARYWYEMGKRAERRELMMQENSDMKEMLRVARERITR
jgi:hypothetical protein